MPRDGWWLPYYDPNANASASLWGPEGIGLMWTIEQGPGGLVDFLCSLLRGPGKSTKHGCPEGLIPPFTVPPGSVVDMMRKRIPKVSGPKPARALLA
jgi:hypothetical protein